MIRLMSLTQYFVSILSRQEQNKSANANIPRHGAPPDQDNKTYVSTKILWTQRQAPSLDESSDPGLSLTHHKACV